ncbi:MAG: DUF4209 domain-containing protein [Pseudomonadota bacterium]
MFENISELHEHLEKNASEYTAPRQVKRLFAHVRNAAGSRQDSEEEQAGWEMEFFDLYFDAGEAKLVDFDGFDERKYAYLETRLNATANPILKARYAHILWCSPLKRHGHIAVDSYLEAAGIYEKQQIENPTSVYDYNLLSSVIDAHSLAHQTKHKTDDVKHEIRRLVLAFPFDNPASFRIRRGLVEHMLKKKRKFSRQDFDGIAEICWKQAEALIGNRDEETAVEFLELGERIMCKTGGAAHRWVKKRAECYEILMEEFRNTPNVILYCQLALQAYRGIGDTGKIKELERKCDDMRSRMAVVRISSEFDPTNLLQSCESLARELTAGSLEEILKSLGTDQRLLPRYEALAATVDAQLQSPHLVDRLNVVTLDGRGHEAQHFTTEEAKRNAKILSSYRMRLERFTVETVKRVLEISIKEKKLSADILLNFLETRTWIGQDIRTFMPGGSAKSYRWSDMISPAVSACIRDITAHIEDPAGRQHCVLAVDSLTLKLEGLIRDLCRSHGITTWSMREVSKGETVSSEKNLGKLLDDLEAGQQMDKDDLLFLKFLLVEQPGYNLRNRVAHALLMSPDEYHIDYCLLLLLALLRLGTYELGDYDHVGPQEGDTEP